MKKQDEGFLSIGLVALAVALALVLTVGMPANFSSEHIKWSDWLGFAGNVLGAGVSLGAATVAWRAVQAQIRVQREANLLQIVTREEDRLETELHSCEACLDFLDRVLDLNPADSSVNYSSRLEAMGFVKEYLGMRIHLEEQGMKALSIKQLVRVSVGCSELLKVAEQYGMAAWIAGASDDSQARSDALIDVETALDNLRQAQLGIHGRQIVISNRLPSMRAMIETAMPAVIDG